MIDLTTIQPTRISQDMRDYIIGIYGEPGIGKSTMASQIPGSLLVAFEPGYHAIANIMAVDANSWNEFRSLVRQLKKPEVKNLYKFIIMDTADIAYIECNKFVCAREGVEKIGDIPHGAGYTLVDNEFYEQMKQIVGEGYGFCWISHSKYKKIKYEGMQTEDSKITSTLSDRARNMLFNFSDVVIYGKIIRNEEGDTSDRLGYVRTNEKHEAKSRLKHMRESFPFSYEAFARAFNESIETVGSSEGAKVVERIVQFAITPEEKLKNTIGDIIEMAKRLRDNGVPIEKINAVIEGNPNNIKDQSIADGILDQMNKL